METVGIVDFNPRAIGRSDGSACARQETGVGGEVPPEVTRWISGLAENTRRIYRSCWRKFNEGVASNGQRDAFYATPEVLLCLMAREDPDVFMEDMKASLGWVMATESAATASLFLRAHTSLLVRLSAALGEDLSVETPELIKAWKKNEGARKRGRTEKGETDWCDVDPGLRNLVLSAIDAKLMALEMAGTTEAVKEAFLTAQRALRER